MIKFDGNGMEVYGKALDIMSEFIAGVLQLLEDEVTREAIKKGLKLQGEEKELAEWEFLRDFAELITKHEQVFVEEEKRINGI